MSQNVAMRLRDHKRSVVAVRHKTPLVAAFLKYGLENFLFEPIVYITRYKSYRSWLLVVEAELIKAHNSIKYGYNIVEFGAGAGPYGKAHSDAVKKVRGTKQSRAKTSRQLMKMRHDPNSSFNLNREAPDAVRRRIENIRKSRKDPKYLELVATSRKESWRRDPQKWFTNGVQEKRLGINDVIPEGWRPGRSTEATHNMSRGAIAGLTPEIIENNKRKFRLATVARWGEQSLTKEM